MVKVKGRLSQKSWFPSIDLRGVSFEPKLQFKLLEKASDLKSEVSQGYQ